jgi:hypothetical protein
MMKSSSPRLHVEPIQYESVACTVTYNGGTPIPFTTVTPCSRPLTALDLLYAWGKIHGPNLGDPASKYEPRHPLNIRRGPVYGGSRLAKRAAGGCPPRSTGRADDAKPRESPGTLTHWSANSPPAPLSA